MKRVACLVCLAAGAVAALAPASASAQTAITSQTLSGFVDPFQDAASYAPAGFQIAWDTTYNPAAHPTTQTLQDAKIHLDNDFSIIPTGLPECPAGSLTGTTTAAAIAACPNSLLGLGGNAILTGGAGGSSTIGGPVTAFQGPPSQVYLHVRLNPPVNLTVILSGTIGTSVLGGDFGQEIDFVVPDTSATGHAITHLDAMFFLEPRPGHYFLLARCFDPDRTWNYTGNFGFRAGGGSFTVNAVQACNLRTVMSTTAAVTSVGKRKKKCKKKRGKKCKKPRK